jgi:hypothetical protein
MIDASPILLVEVIVLDATVDDMFFFDKIELN